MLRSVDRQLPTFLYSLVLWPSSAYEVETILCPETSGNTYQSTQDKVLDGWTPQPDYTSIEQSAFMAIFVEENHRT